MVLFSYIVGAIVALTIYMYIISRLRDRKEERRPPPPQLEEPTYPRERFCPVCKAPLKAHDSLYAEMYEREGRRPQVFIHGCRYCYRPSRKRPKGKELEL